MGKSTVSDGRDPQPHTGSATPEDHSQNPGEGHPGDKPHNRKKH